MPKYHGLPETAASSFKVGQKLPVLSSIALLHVAKVIQNQLETE
jgi:hypothetical protein